MDLSISNSQSWVANHQVAVWSIYCLSMAVFATGIGLSELSCSAKVALTVGFGAAPLPFILYAIKKTSDENQRVFLMKQKEDFINLLGKPYLNQIYVNPDLPSFIVTFTSNSKIYTMEIGPKRDGIFLFVSNQYSDEDLKETLLAVFGEVSKKDKELFVSLTGPSTGPETQNQRLGALRDILSGNCPQMALISTPPDL